MAIVMREKEIVLCYIDGKGNEQVIVFKADVTHKSGENCGYDTQTWSSDGYVRIWKESSTGREAILIPKERVVTVRQVDRP